MYLYLKYLYIKIKKKTVLAFVIHDIIFIREGDDVVDNES